MWACAGCGETNEPTFDFCWKCQTDRPEDAVDVPPQPTAPAPIARGPVSARRLVGRSVFDVVLAAILPVVITAPAMPGASGEGSRALAVLLLEPCLVGVALWRRRAMRRAGEPVELRGPPAHPVGAIVAAVFAGLFMAAIGQVWIRWIVRPEMEPLSTWELVIFGAHAIVVAPLCEEIFFRGSLLAGFAASGRPVLGLATSALLFMAVHPYPQLYPWYFACGLALGGVLLRTRSLRACIVAHAVTNASAVAVRVWG